ncbi:MAG: hypothetical protein RPU42_04130 [Candidatus Sedimenticola sp. (ex Thyasira tokunagai)]
MNIRYALLTLCITLGVGFGIVLSDIIKAAGAGAVIQFAAWEVEKKWNSPEEKQKRANKNELDRIKQLERKQEEKRRAKQKKEMEEKANDKARRKYELQKTCNFWKKEYSKERSSKNKTYMDTACSRR